jgi:protein tyrosine/serine phosphatase
LDGLITDYKRKVLIWDEVSVPMRSVYHTDSKPTFSRAKIKQIMTQTAEPIATREATEWIVRILDSKYEKADLDQVAADAG